MKKILLIIPVLACLTSLVKAQDKDAIAKVHYLNAEDLYNKGTMGDVEKSIDELTEAEKSLGTTNSKILYLKIMAACKFDYTLYNYDLVIWLKKFFKITDAKVFPENKYADIVNSAAYNDRTLRQMVDDPAFEKRIQTDSVFIKKYYEYTPSYKNSGDADYNVGVTLWKKGAQSRKEGWDNENAEKGFMYFTEAAEKGNKSAIDRLFGIYELGLGVKRDLNKCLYYCIKSKDTNMILILYVSSGEQLISNGREVIDWCSDIIDSGNNGSYIETNAMEVIAKIYAKGIGRVPIDHYRAMQWYIYAADHGDGSNKSYYLTFIKEILETRMRNDDKVTQTAIKILYQDWLKSKK